jgi:hypothetical protein
MSILPTTILLTTAGSIEAELATTMVVNEQLLGPRLKMPRVPLRARESRYSSVLGRSSDET